ncbi:MAG TPA: hypothetical protein VIA18_25250 [Polyangia bacterium]|nr:hypothetical protein [Polyangia bacterium]
MRLAMLSTVAAIFIGCATTPPPPTAAPPAADCAGEWQPTPGNPPLPDTLDKSQIVAGMSSVNACVRACVGAPEKRHWYSDKTTMVVTVEVTIASSGQPRTRVVSRAVPPAMSECIVAAVNRASFPPFTGQPMSFTYPYLVR